jgi:hypothetical protein
LLVPLILNFSGVKDECFCRESMDKIMVIGRNSKRIIAFAQECQREDLSFFVPE